MYATILPAKPSQRRAARLTAEKVRVTTGASIIARRRSEQHQQAQVRQDARQAVQVRGREIWSDDEGDFVEVGEGWNR
ncbi:hypothetical protein [Burkholderia glumae]|uniref:hypothetical protein n=1 Tax=Burkholderia glumae TaxID=337 RepID=UPI00215019E6|nr:hypothetical protein [Burkholderia glumae]